MSKYCKAYHARFFRQFPDWQEQTANARTEDDIGANGGFTDEAILYLHDNLTVTHGVLRNAFVVYDRITPEWREFAERVLKFPADAICVDSVQVAV
ncbi:MAG TPA: hypothetical protein VGZ73_15665 [Bryobacteraceae bacterium]|nr:hypothetical protein [Bryobacteraceae bacterium]